MGLADYTLGDKALWQAGRRFERERIIGLLEKRRDDLLGCHKNDDCHVRADAIDVVIDDILFEGKETTE